MGHAANMAGAEPMAQHDAVEVAPEDLGIAVEDLRQRVSRDLRFDELADAVRARCRHASVSEARPEISRKGAGKSSGILAQTDAQCLGTREQTLRAEVGRHFHDE